MGEIVPCKKILSTRYRPDLPEPAGKPLHILSGLDLANLFGISRIAFEDR